VLENDIILILEYESSSDAIANIEKFLRLKPIINNIINEIFPQNVDFWFPIDYTKRKEKYEIVFDILNPYLTIAQKDAEKFKNYDNESIEPIKNYIEKKSKVKPN